MRMTVFTIALAMLLVACSTGTGTLELKITDAPTDLNLSSAVVTISNIEVHMAGGNETNESAWRTVMAGSRTYDLMELRNVTEDLAEMQLPPGKYTQVRLDVENAVVTIDGEEQELDIPSKTIKLVRGFDIVEGQNTTLTLDFDALESIKETGQGKYVMQPTIKILQ